MMLSRFRARLMFPIHNHLGHAWIHGSHPSAVRPGEESRGGYRVRLCSGKIRQQSGDADFPEFEADYGFWKSKDAVREARTAVLVEGQMDFRMSWQSGVKNVIASSGTALTSDHLRGSGGLRTRLSSTSIATRPDRTQRSVRLTSPNRTILP